MFDALARSIAQTAADTLGRHADLHGSAVVSDEAIGRHLWFERGFRDHNTLVQLINATRRILDGRPPPRPTPPRYRKPVQLCLDLRAA